MLKTTSRGAHFGAHFRAPWDNRVKVITGGTIALAMALQLFVGGPAGLIVFAIVLAAAVFGPRGYSVVDDELLVHRLGWATRFRLDPSSSAEWLPNATMGSLRTFGNGGLFGFVGWFRNEILGNYRAFATDGDRIVVVRSEGTPIVVTPEDPEGFVRAVNEATAA